MSMASMPAGYGKMVPDIWTRLILIWRNRMKSLLVAIGKRLLVGTAIVAVGGIASLIAGNWDILVNWVTILGVILVIVAGAPLLARGQEDRRAMREGKPLRIRGDKVDQARPQGIGRSLGIFLVSLPPLVLPTVIYLLMH
jgi:hypothetical protein